jgi:hypothetical protein
MSHRSKFKKNMPFLIFLIGISAFIVSVVVMISRVFSGISALPGSRQWDQMIKTLRDATQPSMSKLVPWDGNDLMPLLSIGKVVPVRRLFSSNKAHSGIVNTIYQEPVIAVSDMRIGKNSIMMARTSNREFVFRSKPNEVEIWVNSQPFAVLAGGALLTSGKTPKLLAQIEPSGDNRQLPVRLGDKTALTIANPAEPPSSPNPRALMLLRPLNPEEEVAVLALTILFQCKPGGK